MKKLVIDTKDEDTAYSSLLLAGYPPSHAMAIVDALFPINDDCQDDDWQDDYMWIANEDMTPEDLVAIDELSAELEWRILILEATGEVHPNPESN